MISKLVVPQLNLDLSITIIDFICSETSQLEKAAYRLCSVTPWESVVPWYLGRFTV